MENVIYQKVIRRDVQDNWIKSTTYRVLTTEVNRLVLWEKRHDHGTEDDDALLVVKTWPLHDKNEAIEFAVETSAVLATPLGIAIQPQQNTGDQP